MSDWVHGISAGYDEAEADRVVHAGDAFRRGGQRDAEGDGFGSSSIGARLVHGGGRSALATNRLRISPIADTRFMLIADTVSR